MKRKIYSQRFFKKWLAAAAVGLLAVIAISSPVNAETFTLAELTAGESFTVGGITFSNWIFDFEDSTVNPSLTGCSVPSSLYCFEVPDTE